MIREQISRFARRPILPRRPLLLLVGVAVGLLVGITTSLSPIDADSRLPDGYRLEALIQRQQKDNLTQRSEVEQLHSQLAQIRDKAEKQGTIASSQRSFLDEASLFAGLVGVEGDGIDVTLDDSPLTISPSGNVNDLVIHSSDVQAVINGMWAAGAEAISINGQRVIATSAILCVGNTLLINGTVHSPPYQISGIGVDRGKFLDDPLVAKLRYNAEKFSLVVSIGEEKKLLIPSYSGSTTPQYAQVSS